MAEGPVRAVVAAAAARVLPVLVLVLGSATACSTIGGGGAIQAVAGHPASSTPAGDLPRTVAWSILDQTVSVLVRNDTDRVLRRGDAVIRVLDASGATLATSATMPDQAGCCTAYNVAPGATFGFSAWAGERSDEATDVRVDYSDTAWSLAHAGPGVTAAPVGLTSDATGAVAWADLTAVGGPVDTAVVQATLDDADGHLVAVTSGRWTCLRPDEPLRARLQLLRPVPAGTVLSSVSAFPVDPSDPATVCP